jgi:hypothetical protein
VAGVEAVDRLHQADVGNLHEVLLGEAALAVAVGDGAGDAHVEHDDLGAKRLFLLLVGRGVQLGEQPGRGRATVGLGEGLGEGTLLGYGCAAHRVADGHEKTPAFTNGR